ncbi:putative RNA-binding Zn ribbon-like protein [Streptosporangium becharense]|uniref:Putative RNA-binding Zn ribbon-like protein n=1 Tax=Streptosporangium becharense TaxID=1816182 RepID=A0A7W9IM62_9ACTN|nr:ABATE domain-containing protein [Streptosporangium becharense]MBB2910504.1 putative RNA-binding Zn ribbon-like protein [Streptosporangium becharense]MBB5823247.1 putative RNA-binding Zn ribbon-like protein [Streptosporangium becharense]
MEFTFVSGNLGLDLAGTVGHRRGERVDLLATPADLARWTVAARLLDAVPAVSEEDLARAVSVREAIYRLASAARDGAPFKAADRELLNRTAERAPAGVRLRDGGGLERTGDLRAALATAARAAVELFGGPDAALIRECEAAPCTRLYVDSSHRRSRRWCDMRGCGNRAKAAAFRARDRPGR